ncbi:MAG: hypothetical protein L0I24_16455, partial [Pseudonocardia sp.]|nr:hypothetical protein [Pseudonocardia sp.]
FGRRRRGDRTRLDPDRIEAVLARRGPHPIGAHRQVMDVDADGTRLRRTVISCTDEPAGDPLVAQAARLRRAGWTVRDLATGHFAMLSTPAALTALMTG